MGAGLPLVSWAHMATSGHWVDRLGARVVPDLVVCNSRFTASMLPPTPARVAVVHHPISNVTEMPIHANRIDHIRRELTTPAGDVVIIQVSRMEPLKGQVVCLEALARLADLPGWTCWQVGGAQRPAERSYLDSLRATADRLGIANRVRFTGERDDVADLLSASNIYCQPNLGPEGFGNTFVEAMAARLPVVTSQIGGAVEVVDDSCGVVVPHAPAATLPDAFAVPLRRLITDRTERERLGERGLARARALCDPATQMLRIAELLESVCRPAVVH
jgi:glycosyltransferase involved in cell wall biosynthesis